MKQNRHFIFTVAALLFGFALSAKAEEVATIGGTGTESDPYTIGTLEQLEAFRNSVNAGETTYNAPGVWVALTDDIDLAGTTWERGIGDGINATYDGIFDGKNHAVKNLNMALKADEVNYLCGGLFGYTYGAAAIKNLVIENANITFTAAETGKQYHNVGVLVGFANNKGGKLNVDNVTVKGDIKVDVPQGYGVGAIVGYSYRAMGAITNTKVTASNGSYIKGERFVGGITGYSYNDAIISNCSVENLTITASKGAAGIAGLALSGNKITGCSVVNTTVNGEANVAYIVGELGGEGDNVVVEDCTAPQPWVGGSWETDESFVATVGTKYYTSLATAIEAAGNGETITLISDFSVDTETYTIAEGKSITLDMNGKTITVTDNKNGSNYELFYVLGELTVTGNGTIELTATYDRDWNAMSTIFHNRGGVLTIENGTFKHLGGTDMAYVVDNSGNYYGDATTNINGGELSSTYIAIRNRMEQNTHGASGKAILNVTDGIISGTSRAIWAQAASTSTTSPATGEINISGGTIGLIDTPRSAGAESMTTITGGTVAAFKGEVGELIVTGDGEITGSVDMLTATGYTANYEITSDGQYKAVATAKIGETTYESLAEAFAAVQDGETITLLSDLAVDTETYTIKDGVAVTLDMNGKKITVTDNKNGTTTEANYELFYVLGELTVTGEGTIELTATYDRDWNSMSTIFHNRGGVLTIENGTFKNLGGTDMAWVVDNSANWTGDAVTNINGGTLYSSYTAIRNRMDKSDNSGVVYLNVTGGVIDGATSAIWAQASSASETAPATGEINISGGEIGVVNTARNAGAESMTTISGGTVAAFKGEVGELTVNGDGTITGSVTILSAAGNAVEYLITDEGLYALAVAKIGDVKYRYLDEAFAVQSEGTITLLEDATIDNVVIVNGNVILDMNGKKIVRAAGYEGDAFEVYGDLNLLNATEGCVDGAIGHVINDADYKTAAYAVTPKSVDKVTYNRTFGHTEWQVLYLPFAVPYEDFKDAFAAYTISGVEDDCVKLVEVTEGGVVEANTPCLVKAHAVGAVTITVEDVELAAEESSLTVNDVYTFAGTCSPMDAEALKSGNCYVLSGGSWMQLAESNTTAVLGAFRVYLTISEATAARSFSMRVVGGNNEDGTTAIEPSQLAPQHEADVIYDLLGRRVTNLTQGIFIVDGKKVVIR